MTAYDRLLDALAEARCAVSPSGNRRAEAQCPAHDDDNPSLSIAGSEGRVLLFCHAGCTAGEVVRELGLQLSDLFDSPKGATYVYPDRKVTRSPDKRFRQYGASKGTPTRLFQLPRVTTAVELGLPVYVVEGENDVLALVTLGGVVATTAPMGAGNWHLVDATPLHGADVIAVVDRDEAGQKWARQVHESLAGKAASLSWREAKAGNDAADHIAAGYSVDELVPVELVFEDEQFVDASNSAVAADWLKDEVGKAGTPLAGLFQRSEQLVYTPRIGEDGYAPLEPDCEDCDDGPAQVRVVDAGRLRARVQFSYLIKKWVKSEEEWQRCMFSADVAGLVVNAVALDKAPNVRKLRGVTHTPMLRKDGTVLVVEGYDDASQRLYLPETGLSVPRVSAEPSAVEVHEARDLLLGMIRDFPWNTDHDRANYLALLLTPLLRELVPPPYKMGLLNAHQRGSGKSLLGWILRQLHGGALRGDVPENSAEFRKQITSILTCTTAPVVQFDNVRHLSSTHLDALLTSDVWSDRPLGSTADVSARNDRLWVATGNNIQLGGDLVRRVLWSSIDPQVPRPELRTDFAITDLKGWVKTKRGELLAALLTLVRAWVVEGRPTGERVGEDDYARWIEACRGVLAVVEIDGLVGHDDTMRQVESEDDEEWAGFLTALYDRFGEAKFAARDVMTLDLDDSWPDGMHCSARAIGKWLGNREGKWAGNLRVKGTAETAAGRLWRIEKFG